MASRAEKIRLKKERLARAAEAARVEAPIALAPAGAEVINVDATRRAFEPRDDGLDLLRSKGRVTAPQLKAGREYGMLFRTASIEGGPIGVVDLNSVGGGGGAGGSSAGELRNLEWIADCRARLLKARSALFHHTEMIAVVDLICGRGMRPREITTVQRETEQIETALRLALDVLAKHFQDEKRPAAEAKAA